MIKIEKLEEENCKSANLTLYWAYQNSKDAENELLNFGEVIWENDIDEIVTFLKENGITEFTISSTFSGLINTLALFEKQGIKMNGLTEVNATYTDYNTGKNKIIPAIKMICQ